MNDENEKDDPPLHLPKLPCQLNELTDALKLILQKFRKYVQITFSLQATPDSVEKKKQSRQLFRVHRCLQYIQDIYDKMRLQIEEISLVLIECQFTDEITNLLRMIFHWQLKYNAEFVADSLTRRKLQRKIKLLDDDNDNAYSFENDDVNDNDSAGNNQISAKIGGKIVKILTFQKPLSSTIHLEIFKSALTLCWNYSDASFELASNLVECGLADLLINLIKNLAEFNQYETPFLLYTAKACVSILHNIVRLPKAEPVRLALASRIAADPVSSNQFFSMLLYLANLSHDHTGSELIRVVSTLCLVNLGSDWINANYYCSSLSSKKTCSSAAAANVDTVDATNLAAAASASSSSRVATSSSSASRLRRIKNYLRRRQSLPKRLKILEGSCATSSSAMTEGAENIEGEQSKNSDVKKDAVENPHDEKEENNDDVNDDDDDEDNEDDENDDYFTLGSIEFQHSIKTALCFALDFLLRTSAKSTHENLNRHLGFAILELFQNLNVLTRNPILALHILNVNPQSIFTCETADAASPSSLLNLDPNPAESSHTTLIGGAGDCHATAKLPTKQVRRRQSCKTLPIRVENFFKRSHQDNSSFMELIFQDHLGKLLDIAKYVLSSETRQLQLSSEILCVMRNLCSAAASSSTTTANHNHQHSDSCGDAATTANDADKHENMIARRLDEHNVMQWMRGVLSQYSALNSQLKRDAQSVMKLVQRLIVQQIQVRRHCAPRPIRPNRRNQRQQREEESEQKSGEEQEQEEGQHCKKKMQVDAEETHLGAGEGEVEEENTIFVVTGLMQQRDDDDSEKQCLEQLRFQAMLRHLGESNRITMDPLLERKQKITRKEEMKDAQNEQDGDDKVGDKEEVEEEARDWISFMEDSKLVVIALSDSKMCTGNEEELRRIQIQAEYALYLRLPVLVLQLLPSQVVASDVAAPPETIPNWLNAYISVLEEHNCNCTVEAPNQSHFFLSSSNTKSANPTNMAGDIDDMDDKRGDVEFANLLEDLNRNIQLCFQ